MNHTLMRQLLPLLMLVALLLAACGTDDIAATGPTGETGAVQTEPGHVPALTEPEHDYTEPEAPAITFPAEPVTEPAQDTPTETVPQEEIPQETYAGGPSGDENELPAIPF